MPQLRDYAAWHQAYDDPDSGISWRLRQVRRQIRRILDETTGPVRVLSVCAGDGRDVLGVLGGRPDADRVSVTLLELLPSLVERARETAKAAGLSTVDVRLVDAGDTASYVGAVPADLVLLVGIFGNISQTDIATTIAAAPGLCAPGATVLWSCGRAREDLTERIRAWFAESGFREVEFVTRSVGDQPALGTMAFDGTPRRLPSGQRLFTFAR